MTKQMTPPKKAGGLRLPAEYTALIGQPRECDQCGVTKPISYKTYAPKKASRDRVSPTCRSCTGRASRKHQLDGGMRKPTKGETFGGTRTVRTVTGTLHGKPFKGTTEGLRRAGLA